MSPTAFATQIENRNFLSSVAFKFNLAKYPKVDFFSNSAIIPQLTLATATQPTYLKDIDVPGEKLTFGDFTLKFLVDENMENYLAVYNWLVGLGFPETTKQFKDITTLLQNQDAFEEVIESFYNALKDEKIDIIVGIESRGFIFAAPLALKLACRFVLA